MCTNCKNNCLEEHADKCIQYTGPDFDRFSIKNGEYYDKIIVDLLNDLQSFVDQTIDLSCIYSGQCDNCEPHVKVPKAVELIIDKLCTLTDEDIKYTGDRYCIGDSSISSGAVFMLGKNFNYGLKPTVNGSSVSYDLTDIVKSLPSDYRVGRINTVISGKPKRGKSIILDSDKSFVGATIANDRFPINIDIDMRVNTPSGDVKLMKSLNIPAPVEGNYIAEMNVKDFGTEVAETFTLKSFLQMTAAQVCSNKTELDSLKNIDLPGCDTISYTSGDFRDILAQQSAVLCDLANRLSALESLSFSVKETDCGVKTYNETPEGAVNVLSGICSSLVDRTNELSRSIQTIQDVGSNNIVMIDGGSTTPTNDSDEGTIISGGCRGGNCT